MTKKRPVAKAPSRAKVSRNQKSKSKSKPKGSRRKLAPKRSATSRVKPAANRNAATGATMWSKPEIITIEGDLKAERYRLSNGLRLIFVPRRIAPVFSYQTWFNVGSRDEDPGYSGMAHLFEHMMFKAVEGRELGEFDRLMESNGARDLNAFTSTDYTAYVQSLPVEAFPMVAELEAERMSKLALTKDTFESERQVVHNERKEHYEDSPEGKMYQELAKQAFRKHPYGWPVIGFAEDLDRMNTQDLNKFYKRFYAPNNAVIVIVGDLQREAVLRELARRYGALPTAKLERYVAPAEPEQKEERRATLELTIKMERAYLAYKIPSAEHDDQLPLAVLSTILSTGRSSRLYQRLVDGGLAIDASTAPSPSKDPALFYVSMATQQGKTMKECVRAFDEVVDSIVKKGVTPDEMERARNKIKTDFYQGLASNSAIARYIGHSEIVLGDFAKDLETYRRLETVRAEEVQRVAKQYLRKDRRTIVIGKPKLEAA